MAYTINTNYTAKYYGSQRTINKIKYIVVHYTANSGTTATAKGNANYFANATRKASAHYVVDENSIIYQCVPDNYVAWSVGDNQKYTHGGASMKGIIINTNSISIEMVSHSDSNGNYYIPNETINHTIELIKSLQKKYNISNDNIYTHWHVTGKLCPKPFIDDKSKWEEFKNRISGLGEEEVVQKYNKVSELPKSLQKEIQELIDAGALKGDEKGNLNITEDMARCLIINKRYVDNK